MQMVKGSNQFGMGWSEHTVTKNVTTHVANRHDGKIIAILNVHAAHTEVALDRLPTTAGGNAHRFVVITNRATRSKGII